MLLILVAKSRKKLLSERQKVKNLVDLLGQYNMIIGRDLLHCIGIDILFSERTIKWNHVSVPMKQVDSDVQTQFYVEDTAGIEDPAERLSKILGTKYAPADLNQIVSGLEHLVLSEKAQLKELLEKYE